MTTAERHITLIRHAHYKRDPHILGGGDLTDKGIEQAQYLAAAVAEQYPVTSLQTSTLRRAIHTTHIIANVLGNMTFTQDVELCEALFYIPPKDAKHFQQQFKDITPEEITAQRIRVAHAYNTYIKPPIGNIDEHDVIVSHGNVMRYFTMRAINAPLDLWTNIEVYHTGITRLVVNSEGSAKLVTHNEIAHLPRRLWSVS